MSPPVTVILTATCTDGGETAAREFSLQVIRQDPTDTEAVTAEGTLLTNSFNDLYDPDGTDTLTVTDNLNLYTSGSYDTTLSWSSNMPAVIAADGTVTRPAPGKSDAEVTLTATVERNGEQEIVTIIVIVPALEETEVLETDAALLAIEYGAGDDLYSITQNITLPTEGEYGSTISWASDSPGTIGADGTVVRPAFQSPDNPPVSVALTATLSYEGETAAKSFSVKVLREDPSETEAVSAAAALLQPDGPNQVPEGVLAPADTQDNVTENITLPTTGEYGTTIAWVSSDTAFIDDDTGIPGAVTLPGPGEGDQTVTLTGTITSGAQTTEITFTLTLCEPYAELAVTIDMSEPANPVDSLGGTAATLNKAGGEDMILTATAGMDSYTWSLSDGSATHSEFYPNGTTPFNSGTASQTVDSALLAVGTSYTLTLWYESGGGWYSIDITFTVIYDEGAL